LYKVVCIGAAMGELMLSGGWGGGGGGIGGGVRTAVRIEHNKTA
jgi:hypothetical protein